MFAPTLPFVLYFKSFVLKILKRIALDFVSVFFAFKFLFLLFYFLNFFTC